ncbi:MAG: hypothetical protein ABDH49_08280 [Candidatus Hydrothermales bacterium]
MFKKFFLVYFLLLKSCISSAKLPPDFDTNLVIFINLMPSPIQYPRKVKGSLEIKGSFDEEPQLKEIKILFDDFEISLPFSKAKENTYLFEIPFFPLKEEKIKKNLKFKLTLSYKRKMFEIVKENFEIKRVY